MALYGKARDVRLFRGLNTELLHKIIEQQVGYYKVKLDDTPDNGSNDPRWRTVLISGIGAGGNGIFALDITDINNQ